MASLSLYPHLHVLVPEGLFVPDPADPDGPLRLEPLPAPSDTELVDLTCRLAQRLAKVARRHLTRQEEGQGDELPEQALLRHYAGQALRSLGEVPPTSNRTVNRVF